MGPLMYLVYRDRVGFSWRFPNGEVPGQISQNNGPWLESVCTPRDFYEPGEDAHDVLESGFTVSIEEMTA